MQPSTVTGSHLTMKSGQAEFWLRRFLDPLAAAPCAGASAKAPLTLRLLHHIKRVPDS
jgi:hypothetical protein